MLNLKGHIFLFDPYTEGHPPCLFRAHGVEGPSQAFGLGFSLHYPVLAPCVLGIIPHMCCGAQLEIISDFIH